MVRRDEGSWRGVTVVEGQLSFAPARFLPGKRLVFARDALVVVGRRSTSRLVWDEGFPPTSAGGWWVTDTGSEFPQVVVVRGRMPGAFVNGRPPDRGDDRWVFRRSLGLSLTTPTTTVAALAEYLARTPNARAGLEDENRLRLLVEDLKNSPVPPSRPSRRVAGVAGDLDFAIHRGLDRTYPRRFSGYGVAGEPAPEAAAIRSAIVDGLAPHQADAATDGSLDASLERALPKYQWPFARLVSQ